MIETFRDEDHETDEDMLLHTLRAKCAEVGSMSDVASVDVVQVTQNQLSPYTNCEGGLGCRFTQYRSTASGRRECTRSELDRGNSANKRKNRLVDLLPRYNCQKKRRKTPMKWVSFNMRWKSDFIILFAG